MEKTHVMVKTHVHFETRLLICLSWPWYSCDKTLVATWYIVFKKSFSLKIFQFFFGFYQTSSYTMKNQVDAFKWLMFQNNKKAARKYLKLQKHLINVSAELKSILLFNKRY